MICAICCGSEREVTIDCPSDCAYLIASRQHYEERRELDREHLPFGDQEVPRSILQTYSDLFTALSYKISAYAAENPSLVDTDVQPSLAALAETYQTLAKGIVYEKPPDQPLQRELYKRLWDEVEDFKKSSRRELIAAVSVRDGDIRDVLILFTQLAALRSNGRPKGRAFIDALRRQFKPGTFAKASSPLIVAP
jgi:hypothetical protein